MKEKQEKRTLYFAVFRVLEKHRAFDGFSCVVNFLAESYVETRYVVHDVALWLDLKPHISSFRWRPFSEKNHKLVNIKSEARQKIL